MIFISPSLHYSTQRKSMKKSCFVLLTGVLAVLSPAMSTAAPPASETAAQLVTLTKPEQREAQAIRFMLAVAPMAVPETLADCMVAKAGPAFTQYFTALYGSLLTEAELLQAVDFYQSKLGRAAVALRLQHEQHIFELAVKGEQVAEERPQYPPETQRALDAFAATPAGKKLLGDALAAQDPFSTEISTLRSSVMSQCLTEPASPPGGR